MSFYYDSATHCMLSSSGDGLRVGLPPLDSSHWETVGGLWAFSGLTQMVHGGVESGLAHSAGGFAARLHSLSGGRLATADWVHAVFEVARGERAPLNSLEELSAGLRRHWSTALSHCDEYSFLLEAYGTEGWNWYQSGPGAERLRRAVDGICHFRAEANLDGRFRNATWTPMAAFRASLESSLRSAMAGVLAAVEMTRVLKSLGDETAVLPHVARGPVLAFDGSRGHWSEVLPDQGLFDLLHLLRIEPQVLVERVCADYPEVAPRWAHVRPLRRTYRQPSPLLGPASPLRSGLSDVIGVLDAALRSVWSGGPVEVQVYLGARLTALEVMAWRGQDGCHLRGGCLLFGLGETAFADRRPFPLYGATAIGPDRVWEPAGRAYRGTGPGRVPAELCQAPPALSPPSLSWSPCSSLTELVVRAEAPQTADQYDELCRVVVETLRTGGRASMAEALAGQIESAGVEANIPCSELARYVRLDLVPPGSVPPPPPGPVSLDY